MKGKINICICSLLLIITMANPISAAIGSNELLPFASDCPNSTCNGVGTFKTINLGSYESHSAVKCIHYNKGNDDLVTIVTEYKDYCTKCKYSYYYKKTGRTTRVCAGYN